MELRFLEKALKVLLVGPPLKGRRVQRVDHYYLSDKIVPLSKPIAFKMKQRINIVSSNSCYVVASCQL